MDDGFTAWLMADTFGLEDDGTDVPPWHRDAACRDVPTGVFFDDGGNHGPAKAICAECPVRQQCLDFALETGEKFGVWGGLSAKERAKLARRAA